MIKRFKNFSINETSSYNVLDNSFIKALLEDAELSYEISEDPDGIAFDAMDAISVFRWDYNEDHPFIHYLNELGNRFEYTPAMGLSHDSLNDNASRIYDELVNGEEFYKDKFLEGIYESKLNEGSNDDNYEIKDVNISTIKPGDTVKHNGVISTVGTKDILNNPGGMGYTLFGDSYKLGKTPVKKVTYLVKEGISSEGLNPKQKHALEELKTSDVSLFSEVDYQHYADKIGVTIEEVMELVADGGTSTKEEETVEETESELEELVQRELIDNPDVDGSNLTIKIQELVDKLENDDYYEWGDEEWDEYLGKYETLADSIKNIYNELSGVNNPNQISMEFESNILKFNMFLENSEGERMFIIKLWNVYGEVLDGLDGIISEFGELPTSYFQPNTESDMDNITDKVTNIETLMPLKNDILKSSKEILDGLEVLIGSGRITKGRYFKANSINKLQTLVDNSSQSL